MPETEAKPKRVRPRPNAIMVELDEDDRGKLEFLRDLYQAGKGVPISLSLAVRLLIREAHQLSWDGPKKNSKKSRPTS